MDDVSKGAITVVLALAIGTIAFVVARYILEKTFTLLVNVAVTVVVCVVVFSYCNSSAHKCDVLSASTTFAAAVEHVHVFVQHVSVTLGSWWKIARDYNK